MSERELKPASPESDESPRMGWRETIREAIFGGTQDGTAGPISRALVLLAIPMILEMALESVFAVADIWFLSRLGGDDALATVGLTESVLTLVYGVCIGLAMATTAMVARRVGEKRPEAAADAAVQAILLGLVMAVLSGIPAFLYADRILEFMGGSDDVVAAGTPYCRIQLGANVVIFLLFLNNAIFRGSGDAATAMRALWLANGINLILDPCLIFGLGPFPEMGLTGAAIATVTGRGLGVAFQLWILFRGNRLIRITRERLRVIPVVMKRLFRLSLPGMGQFLVATASHVAMVRIIAVFGDVAVAGWTLAIRILIFALLPAYGMSNATAAMVGQNLGAKRPDRSEKAVWYSCGYNTILMVFVTIGFSVFPELLIGLFKVNDEVRAVGIQALRTIGYGCIFYGWGMVTMQAFNGSGDTVTPLWVNLFIFWVFQLPVAWGLSHTLGMGEAGVFWAPALAYSLNAIVGILLFRRGKWKTREV